MIDLHYSDAHFTSGTAVRHRQLTRLEAILPALEAVKRRCPDRLNTWACTVTEWQANDLQLDLADPNRHAKPDQPTPRPTRVSGRPINQHQ